jgi:predicted DNA-binding protein (UPF0251 family)
MNGEDHISTQEAADLIGISKRAVIDALNAGKIAGKLMSKQWIVSKRSAEAYKAERDRRMGKEE